MHGQFVLRTICPILPRMDRFQFRRLLNKAGLTQVEAGRLIGVTDRTMRRYVSGETPVPRVVVYALLYVIHVQKELELEPMGNALARLTRLIQREWRTK